MRSPSFWAELKARMRVGSAPVMYSLYQYTKQCNILLENASRIVLDEDNSAQKNYLYCIDRLEQQLTKNAFGEDFDEVEKLLSQLEILKKLANFLFNKKIHENRIIDTEERCNKTLTSTQCSIRFEKFLDEFGLVAISNDDNRKRAYIYQLEIFEKNENLPIGIQYQLFYLKAVASVLFEFNTIYC